MRRLPRVEVCSADHQKMALKKAASGGSLTTGRHKDICGVLSKWREVRCLPPPRPCPPGMWAPGFYPRAVRGFQREPTSSLALKPGQCCSTGSLTAGAASGSPCPLAAPPTGAPPRRHTTLRRRIVSKLTKDIIITSGGYARRCWCPRSPCIDPSGGCAGRCWRPRSRCTCS